MRILMALMGLGFSTPVFSDDAACLAEPTRACVFEMARAEAGAADFRNNVSGWLVLAAAQEKARDMSASSATLDQLIALMDANEPNLDKQAGHWDFQTVISARYIVDAPVMAVRLAEHIKGDHPQAMRARISFASLAGDAQSVAAILAVLPKKDAERLARSAICDLALRSDYVAAYDMGARYASTAHVDYCVVDRLLALGKVEAAEIVVAGMTEPKMRADGLIDVAEAMARQGKVGEVTRLLQPATELSIRSGSPDANVLDRAYLLALLGDVAGAKTLLESNPTDEIKFRPHMPAQIRLIAAMVAGDKAALDAQLAEIHSDPVDLDTNEAALACLQAMTCDPMHILALTDGQGTAGVLNAIGLIQAQAGDSVAALATFETIRALGPNAPIHYGFGRELVLLLAAEGKTQLALELAVEGKDPMLFADLALLLD